MKSSPGISPWKWAKHLGNRGTLFYGFIFRVSLSDFVQKQTGCWVHCEPLGEKGDTKRACVNVPVFVHADVCVLDSLLSHFKAWSGCVALLQGWSEYCTAYQDLTCCCCCCWNTASIRDTGTAHGLTFHYNVMEAHPHSLNKLEGFHLLMGVVAAIPKQIWGGEVSCSCAKTHRVYSLFVLLDALRGGEQIF